MTRRRLDNFRFWLAPGMGVKRHVSLAAFGTLLLMIGVMGVILWAFAGDRQSISDPIEDVLVSDFWETYGIWISVVVLLLGLAVAIHAISRLNRSLLSHWLERPSEIAEMLHRNLLLSKGPRIVALGGGTGLSMLLSGLREHSSNLTAVVSVADDGGSSGRLRKAFDMPAPGDLSDCLAALSDSEQELGRLLQYRFVRGQELEGHTFGNLLITTMTEVEGDFGSALESLNSLLNLNGRVYPAATMPVSLIAEKDNGVEVRGESALRHIEGPVRRIRIEPEDARPPERLPALIEAADVVVLGPGSLFTSTLPPLLVPEIREAVLKSRARIVYFCNIMTERGETDGMDALDHVKMLQEHLGTFPDVVVVNSQHVDPDRLDAYAAEGATQVLFDPSAFEAAGLNVVQLELLAKGEQAYHDSATLAEWLVLYARQQSLPRAR